MARANDRRPDRAALLEAAPPRCPSARGRPPAAGPGSPARSRATDPPLASRQAGQDREQLADVLLAGDWVRKREVRVDRVVIAPPVSLAGDVVGVGELDNDPVRGTLGDSDTLTDIAQADPGVVS